MSLEQLNKSDHEKDLGTQANGKINRKTQLEAQKDKLVAKVDEAIAIVDGKK